MRRVRRFLAALLLALPLLLTTGGCSKNDKWGEDIESPPADLAEIRRKAAEKRKSQGKPAAPANPTQPSSGQR